MASYLFIKSRDPFEIDDSDHYYNSTLALKNRDNEAMLFLVQNGVFLAHQNPRLGKLSHSEAPTGRILADEFSLGERGITADSLLEGLRSSPLDIVIDEMVANTKIVWH